MCNGLTKSGFKCKNKTEPYCYLHLKLNNNYDEIKLILIDLLSIIKLKKYINKSYIIQLCKIIYYIKKTYFNIKIQKNELLKINGVGEVAEILEKIKTSLLKNYPTDNNFILFSNYIDDHFLN